jgi:hypothetical protein
MALVTRMVSDITGHEGPESDFATLIVRRHPEVGEPKSLDVLPDEVKGLRDAPNVVTLELRRNGHTREFVMLLADFRKVVPDEVVEAARGTRGRRPGFRPTSKA